MTLSKSHEQEITKVVTDYWDKYLNGNLTEFQRFLKDDYHNIGTTRTEDWKSKAEMMDYSKAVIDQLVGTVQIRNRNIHIQPIEPYFMVNEQVDLFIKTGDEWVFYNQMRLTSLIEKTNEGWKSIEIEDNGPGIPDEIKDKILQPFFTTKKGTQGTGLGLSITHDIIKAHGGELDIQSQPGRTIFSLTLPC